MKSMKSIQDPEAFQLLADETRRKIVFLLRVKEMTVSQIAADLNVTPQAVYHHIKKLLKAGMVEVVREERIDHLIESYYRATAESFQCSVGTTPHGAKAAKEQVTTILNTLKRIGFKIEFNENKISQIVKTQIELEKSCNAGRFENKITELDDVDPFTKLTVSRYAETLAMSEEQFTRQQELERKFRDLLLSLTKK